MKKWMLTTAALALAGCAQINSYQDAVQTPAPASLRAAAQAIEAARAHGSVLVCCALGYSRSAASVVTWLVLSQRAASVSEAMAWVRAARPSIVLGPHHQAAIAAACAGDAAADAPIAQVPA